MNKEQNFENQILQVAENLFLEKGFAGTSTTDIAKEVGCNQALVHYYFRTKENLFLRVFQNKIESIFLTLLQPLLNTDEDFFDKMRHTMSAYFDFLAKESRLAFFVINELLCNKKRLMFVYEYFMSNSTRTNVYEMIDSVVQAEVKKGTIRQISTVDFVLDIVSLTVFNFIAFPIYSDLSGSTKTEKNAFLEQRKQEIITLAINGMRNHS